MPKIFLSYARADKRWFDEAMVQLAPLIRERGLEVWTDEQIPVGSDWREEIEKALEESGVGLVLVTPAFLASNFIAKTELPALLQKRVVWIPVSASNVRVTPLAKLQAAWPPSEPLDTLSKPKRSQAWVTISKRLEEVLKRSDESEKPSSGTLPSGGRGSAEGGDDKTRISSPEVAPQVEGGGAGEAELSPSELRQRLERKLSRDDLATVWHDVFDASLENAMPGRSHAACTIETVERARRTNRTDRLVAYLRESFPHVLPPDPR